MKKAASISLLFLLLFSGAMGQNGKLKRGNALFERGEYEQSIEWYAAGLKKDKDEASMKRMITACMANRKYELAEQWLAELTTDLGLDPKYYFYYGQVLLTNGKPEEARKWFFAYGSEGGDQEIADGYIALIDQTLRSAPDLSKSSVEPVPFNSPFTEFGAQWYGDGIAFASERRNFSKGLRHRSLETETPLLNLYTVEQINEATWTKPKPLERSLNSTQHEGPAVFSPDGNRMYLNRSQKIPRGGKESGGPALGLYTSDLVKGKWSKPAPLTFSDASATYLHPAISPDGKWLFFAADLAGGEGGFDLYKAALLENGVGNPISLGSAVNTPFDEFFPVFHESGRLFFATTGHPGYGGLDLFETRPSGNHWTTPRNLDQPLNSQWDDFHLLLNAERTEGFLATNRTGKNLNDDLFKCWIQQIEFDECPPEASTPLCYRYEEKGTGEALPYQLIYEWSFGDGNIARGVTAQHCYQDYGSYQITLTAIDSLTGEPLFSQAHYQLQVEPPSGAIITLGDNQPGAGTVRFHARNTSLPGYTIEGYYWDVGAGFQPGGVESEGSFEVPGTAEVKLGIVAFNEQELVEERFCVSKEFELGTDEPVTQAVQPEQGQVVLEFSVVELRKPEFRIQLGTSTERVALDDPVFKDLDGVIEVVDNGLYRYYYDVYGTRNDALKKISDYRGMGFTRAVVMTFEEQELKSPRIFRENWLPDREVVVMKPEKTLLRWKNVNDNQVMLEEQVELAKMDSLLRTPHRRRYLPFQEPDYFFPLDFNLNRFNRTDPLKKSGNFRLASLSQIANNQIPVYFNNLFYEPDAYRVPTGAWQEIFRITRFLLENPWLSIEVIGHTDGIELGGNRTALRRASEVAQFLVLSGCPVSSVKLSSAGATLPLTAPVDKPSMALNRRVSFRIKIVE